MKSQEGLTLVEVLVAMAILGIILLLITNWQTQTLQLTTKTNALAEQLTELNDLSGYVGDRVRSAIRVRVATSGLDVNSGSNKTCSTTSPCLAAVIPEDTTTGTVLKYDLYIYRIEPRSVVTLDKTVDAWAESNVVVLREYRSNDTTSPINCVLGAGETFETATAVACGVMRNLSTLTSVSSFQPYLVTDYLSATDQAGNAITPFSVKDTSKPVSPANPVTLTFQTKRNVRGTATYTPDSSPYTLTVQPRNVPCSLSAVSGLPTC